MAEFDYVLHLQSGGPVSGPRQSFVDAGGRRCRVWEMGDGLRVFWLASAPLLYRWTAIHEALAKRVRLIVCSLPGFPGNERNHENIDDHLEWCLAAHDLLLAAGFNTGDTLMGSSIAGALAADVAAIWPDEIRQLLLIAPHGLFDPDEPTRDIFAMHPRDAASLVASKPNLYKAQLEAPAQIQPVLWSIEMVRANEAGARISWPLGDTRLSRRLARISARTRIIWGRDDQIIPPGYAQRFARKLPTADVVLVPDAGHVAEIDAPEPVAAAILQFLDTIESSKEAHA